MGFFMGLIAAPIIKRMTGLMNDFGAAAIAGFVDAVDEIAPEQLKALRQLIEEKMEDPS